MANSNDSSVEPTDTPATPERVLTISGRHAFLCAQTEDGDYVELVVSVPDQQEERNYQSMIEYISDCDGTVLIDRDCEPGGRVVVTVDQARNKLGLDRDD